MWPPESLAKVVADAPEGSTLRLAEGIYELEEGITIAKPLSILGAERDKTRVVSRFFGVLNLNPVGKVVIQGLSLEWQGKRPADVIRISNGSYELRDCRVRGIGGQSESDSGTGIYILSNGAGRIQNCEISENSRDGIFLGRGSLTITDSTVRSNGFTGLSALGNITARNLESSNNGTDGVAIMNAAQIDSDGLKLRGNIGVGLVLSGGFGGSLGGEVKGLVKRSLIEENLSGGVEITGRVQATLEGNTIRKNLNTGIVLRGVSRPLIRGNTISENSLHGIAFLGNGAARLKPTLYRGTKVMAF